VPDAMNNGLRIRYEVETAGPPLLPHIDGLNHATAINRSDAILPHVTTFLARVRRISEATS
jgi:hypothetical protein